MAGMLPGVESARRRRFHKSNNLANYYGSDQFPATLSRRSSSFCLYATIHSNSSMVRNPTIRQEAAILCDESMLSAAAREAKKRLDQRLQPQWRSQNKRYESSTPISTKERLIFSENRPNIQSNSQPDEVPTLKRSGLKRLSWFKLGWKSSKHVQDECAVCLEQLRAGLGGTLIMQLPCAHRFHTNCLVPWLEANAHCPCCRLEIPSA
ncbi:hypothetical protein OROHE_007627 [Orobanche hederae]